MQEEDVKYVSVSDIVNSCKQQETELTNALLGLLVQERKKENEIQDQIRKVLNDLVAEIILFQEIYTAHQSQRSKR